MNDVLCSLATSPRDGMEVWGRGRPWLLVYTADNQTTHILMLITSVLSAHVPEVFLSYYVLLWPTLSLDAFVCGVVFLTEGVRNGGGSMDPPLLTV